MRLASFCIDGTATWGLIGGDVALDVGAKLTERFADLKAALRDKAWEAILEASASARRVPVDDIAWLPVIPNPDKIICVGLNYEMHRKETRRSEVAFPTIFTRFANSQTGHLTNIIRPNASVELDYEGELAVIIGEGGRHIRRDLALSHIAGYACYNEASVRDFQRHTHQFTPGKNFPQTGAFGPWMVTPDELGDVRDLQIQTRLNDVVVQDAYIREMIFDIGQQIEYCSTFTRLEPGDVIVTGTPGGVGSRRAPPLWMRPGDVVEVEIEGIAVLRNTVAQEAEVTLVG